MARSKEITKKLKMADSEIAAYMVELEKENLRLHKMVAKLQVKCVSQNNEIKALKEQAKKPGAKIIIQGYSSEKETK
jgi:hypothetical protein